MLAWLEKLSTTADVLCITWEAVGMEAVGMVAANHSCTF